MMRVAWLGVMTMAVSLGLGAAGCGGGDEPVLSQAERCAVIELQAQGCAEDFCRENRGSPFCMCFEQSGNLGLNEDSCGCEGSFRDGLYLCSDDLDDHELLDCADEDLQVHFNRVCRGV